jgi:hypothetical protein
MTPSELLNVLPANPFSQKDSPILFLSYKRAIDDVYSALSKITEDDEEYCNCAFPILSKCVNTGKVMCMRKGCGLPIKSSSREAEYREALEKIMLKLTTFLFHSSDCVQVKDMLDICQKVLRER